MELQFSWIAVALAIAVGLTLAEVGKTLIQLVLTLATYGIAARRQKQMQKEMAARLADLQKEGGNGDAGQGSILTR